MGRMLGLLLAGLFAGELLANELQVTLRDPDGEPLADAVLWIEPGQAMLQLDSLRRLGVRLSIDDYGTGYSSIAQLKRLPVHELKIDKSFIQDLPDEIIVRSTIELGHNMGLQVVAEGVESLEILEQLDRLGCDIAQGYLLSKPLSAGAFSAWLESCPWQLPRTA